MAILAECDICGNQHRVKDGLVGQRIRCKDCGTPIVVPSGQIITSDDFVEQDGRLRRREQGSAPDRNSWPLLIACLVASLVFIALLGVVWSIFSR